MESASTDLHQGGGVSFGCLAAGESQSLAPIMFLMCLSASLCFSIGCRVDIPARTHLLAKFPWYPEWLDAI